MAPLADPPARKQLVGKQRKQSPRCDAPWLRVAHLEHPFAGKQLVDKRRSQSPECDAPWLQAAPLTHTLALKQPAQRPWKNNCNCSPTRQTREVLQIILWLCTSYAQAMHRLCTASCIQLRKSDRATGQPTQEGSGRSVQREALRIESGGSVVSRYLSPRRHGYARTLSGFDSSA